jgi:hypothetical protein
LLDISHLYSCTLPLTSAVDGASGQHHTPAALPRERPGTYCIGWASGTIIIYIYVCVYI